MFNIQAGGKGKGGKGGKFGIGKSKKNPQSRSARAGLQVSYENNDGVITLMVVGPLAALPLYRFIMTNCLIYLVPRWKNSQILKEQSEL